MSLFDVTKSADEHFISRRQLINHEFQKYVGTSLNTAIAVLLFFVASFVLIYAAITTPLVQFYTGGIVVALFMTGLFYAWLNAIRQGRKLSQSKTTVQEASQDTR